MADLEQLVYENGVITMPSVRNEMGRKGIGTAYFRCMTKNKDKIFQIDGVTNEEETFGAVLQRSVRTALKMKSLGVTSEDIVTICSLNNLDCCVPYIACTFLGALSANIDPLFPLTDSMHYLKTFDPRIIFVEENAVKYVEAVLEKTGRTSTLVVFGNSDKYMSFSEFIKPFEDENKFTPVEVDPSKTAVLLFSSGSTGLPKVICISHQAHMLQARVFMELKTSYERMLCCHRMFSVSTSLFLTVSILTGVSRMIVPKYDPELVLDVIKRQRPKILYLTPYQILTICDLSNFSDVDVKCLETNFVGGAAANDHQIEQMKKFFPNAETKKLYGLSEAGLVFFCYTRTKKEHELSNSKLGTIGSVINGLSYKVVDVDSRKVLGPYEKGELLVKSLSLMSGYYELDSSDAWDSDDWLKTGDMVYYDEDFYFYYVDRIKKLMKYRSMYVVPTLIENVLITHPKVKEAYVVSKFHETDGDLPTAVVKLDDSCKNLEIEKELYDFVAENLEDKFKLRGGVKVVQNFPVAFSGKVDVVRLKQLINSNQI